MSAYGIWKLSDGIFDAAVVDKVNDWTLKAVLPDVGAPPCTIRQWDMAPSVGFAGHPHYSRGPRLQQMQKGDRLKVKVHMHWSEGREGLYLDASEVDGQLQHLRDLQRQNQPVVVRARVTDKMTGALGVHTLTFPFHGLRGVVHRINLPGATTQEQHRFAADATIGDIVLCTVQAVQDSWLAHWQVVLGMRHGFTAESTIAPPLLDNPQARWIDKNQIIDAVVEKRVDDNTLQVEFKTGTFSTMVCHLTSERMLGTSDAVRKERFQRVRPGDSIAVKVQLVKRHGQLTLQATEAKRLLLTKTDLALSALQPVLVNARVVKKNKNSVWVDVTSQELDAFRGVIRFDRSDARQSAQVDALEVGSLVVVRVSRVNFNDAARLPLILSLSLLREQDAAKNWKLAS